MELVTVDNNQLIINKEVENELKRLYEYKAKFDVQMDKVKKALLEAMESNFIKSYEDDFLKITYILPSIRKTVDTSKLKEDGLYEKYTKESETKASIKVAFK